MKTILPFTATLTLVIALSVPDTRLNAEELASSSNAYARVQPAEASAENVAAIVKEGRSLFNQTCAHCHGPDAVTGLSERNLRRLRARYGDDMPSVFRTTVTNGRPDKGMPVWGEILDDKTITLIFSYLETVQEAAQ